MAASPQFQQLPKDPLPTEFLEPQPGPQSEFLSSSADIVVYGGSAGGGKSYGLLLEFTRHIWNPNFGAVVFRRTSEEIRMEGGLWDEAQNIYPLIGARGREQMLDFRFPSGASITLDAIQHEQDKMRFQGAQICGMGFDELTHFSQSQFFYMLSRNRSTCGIRPYIRATTNPDATSWVKEFLAPWLDKTYPKRADSGELRWFIRESGEIHWVPAGTPDAKSVTFIRANVFDNKILIARDPGYIANLKALSLVDRRRLLDGDWDVTESGNFFRREWFGFVACAPAEGKSVRFWDLAATEQKPGTDPDWSVGTKIKRTDGIFYIEDVQRTRTTPGAIEKLVVQCAKVDGKAVAIRMEQEPGSSGVAVIARYATLLAGYDFRGRRSSGDKAERAKPYSAQAEAGNVKLVQGYWNADFLNEHVPFPSPLVHDDQVDSAKWGNERTYEETHYAGLRDYLNWEFECFPNASNAWPASRADS